MPYSGDPGASPVDAVRFWLQDTGAVPLLGDTEIQYVRTALDALTAGNPIRIAAECCSVIQAKYAGEVSIQGDGITYSGEQLQDKYAALGQSLRAQANRLDAVGAKPDAGGLIDGEQPDSQLRPPLFGIGMNDNPEAGVQRTGFQGDFACDVDEASAEAL